jgi:hypothetical protein
MAKAFVDSLSRLPLDQYAAVPSGQYGREYTTLRNLALQVQPAIDVRLLGPSLTISTLADGHESCNATYAEIETYARQIMEQLALAQPAPTQPAGANQAGNAKDLKIYCVEEIRRTHPRAYAPWEAGDDARLEERFCERATIEDLAREFGRQPGAIRSRLRKLGLTE